MRKFLDGLYNVAAYAAALFMVSILVCVLLLIVGRQVGWYIPGLNAYAGYSMAAASFLALAHTFRHNEHIRVTLVLNALNPKWRHVLNLLSLFIALVLAANVAYYSIHLVMESYEFNDLSVEEDATPLWIPQLAMAIGSVLFAVALLEELVRTFITKKDVIASSTAE
ncbi:TRAP transporter small permease [Pelistega europaea]|uniref:TRAP transporter small permease protein n=1 Tax=Pelistega europaea TaxID=106147 RepID=A0A7Y4LAK8_9BURK|nr:TRAP transporter small permease subunit [Pelistega europaea]NOL50059.1 TRAP transporter small permease subunit [Pelistega europaea]